MSEKKCCVPKCDKTLADGIKLHKFPNPEIEPDHFRNWLYAVGGDVLGMENQEIFKKRRVCREHFEKRYHYGQRLAATALPTLNLPGYNDATKVTKVDHTYSYASAAIPTIRLMKSSTKQQTDESTITKSQESAQKPQDYLSKTLKINNQKLQSSEVESGTCCDIPESSCEVNPSPCDIESNISEADPAVNENIGPETIILDSDCQGLIDEAALDLDVDPDEGGIQPDSYFCDACSCVISGARYACVQCERDECTACAGSTPHAHYMLRVPPHTPNWEARSVIAAVRQIVHKCLQPAEVKVEVKDEEDALHTTEEDLFVEGGEGVMDGWEERGHHEYNDEQMEENPILFSKPTISPKKTTTFHKKPRFSAIYPLNSANVIPIHTKSKTWKGKLIRVNSVNSKVTVKTTNPRIKVCPAKPTVTEPVRMANVPNLILNDPDRVVKMPVKIVKGPIRTIKDPIRIDNDPKRIVDDQFIISFTTTESGEVNVATAKVPANSTGLTKTLSSGSVPTKTLDPLSSKHKLPHEPPASSQPHPKHIRRWNRDDLET